MILTIRSGLIVLASLLLGACASMPRLSQMELPRTDADLVIVMSQQELEVVPSVIGVQVGGMLGGMSIDSTNDRNAEQAFAPLRDRLLDYELAQVFADKLMASGVTGQLVAGAEPTLRFEQMANDSVRLSRPMLVLVPTVRMENLLRALVVQVHLYELLPNPNGGRANRGASHYYKFVWPVNANVRLGREEAIALWLEWSNDDLVALIERGMDESLRMLSAHLDEPVLALPNQGTRVRSVYVQSHSELVWRVSGDLRWLAGSPDGWVITALPDHGIL